MFKNFKVIRIYYRFSKIKWKYVIFEFIILLIPSLLSILSPILTANIISSITVYDFKRAIMMLSLDFVIIIATTILYFIYHFISSKSIKKILISTSDYVYESIKSNNSVNKINASTMTDIWTFSHFNNFFLYKVCFLIKSIIILIIIFQYNFLISIALVGVSLISALLLSFTNKQIQKNNLLLTESKSKSLELFNSIQKGASINTDSYMDKTIKNKYFNIVDSSIKTNNKISLFYSLNNNFINLILKTAVFLLTFFLITQVKSTYLSLSSYLILTPYLTSSAQNLIAFFDLFPEIGLLDNIINQFNDLSCENIKTESENQPTLPNSYKLQFFHSSLNSKEYKVEDFSAEIEYKEIVQIIGGAKCGKRAIFDLISKKANAESGSVFIGEININNISNADYSKILSSTYKDPYFYNISILENLLIVNNSKTKISKAIKELGLEKIINSLPSKLDTIVDENISEKTLFFLGLIRVYLSSPKIICIYEIPENFEDEINVFYNALNIINENSTIILFLHEKLNISSSRQIYIEDSKQITK